MNERIVAALRRRGFTPGQVLGTGMEGTVVALTDDLVAKIWHGRSLDDLDALLGFGLALGAAPIPFTTAGAIELLEADGVCITIERKVGGIPLRKGHQPDPPVAGEKEAKIIGDVLAGLSLATDPRLGGLPLLPGETPLGSDTGFGAALADRIDERFTASAANLRSYVPDVDALAQALIRELRMLPDLPRTSLIHGDLVPPNILIAEERVAGVLDFGFLTTLGDPQFDAAVTASIFDMYGVNARRSEQVLSRYFVDRFSHDDRTYALYRAAYAFITHAVFGNDSSDGHFAWCAAMLARSDIRVAVE